MDLNKIITFQTIIKQGTFSKPAESMHYAQTTIKKQIQQFKKK
ncbi:LysR family transcriptional regulator [Streptococcus hyovaginalis]